MRTASKVTDRYIGQPPSGKCGSGRFSFWTVKDTHADLGKQGNDVVDYYSDCMPGAEQQANERAAEYNGGTVKPWWWGVSHGEPESA